MTRVAVVVPYRPDGGGPRERNWVELAGRWRRDYPGWELRDGVHLDGAWCKASAAETALDGCTADVLVVADADVWCEPAQALLDAVTLVRSGRRPWVVPHRRVARLSPAGTGRWIAGERDGVGLDQAPYRGIAGGGLFVISRAGWDSVGGFDRRFVGWGQEDLAFARAADTLIGRHHRLGGTLWHLWHPPAPRLSRQVGSAAGRDLLAEYRKAGRDAARMTEIVAAAREGR